jgi:dTDP-4-amino-4,6-dideoxygalactose transaminase
VLVDVDKDSFNIDIEAVQKAITPKTKAIIPVHLFGQCANMEAVLEIAKQHHLYVIEDTAQAVGANYFFKNGESKKAGAIGDIGTTSFFPSKNLGCYGDGGAIFTNNDDLAHIIRGLVNHGMYKRYYHDAIGVNSRLDSIQAAILRIKLPHLDSYNESRRKAADYYDQAFAANPNIITPAKDSFSSHVYHQYTLKIANHQRDELHEHLKEKNIPNAIYYPIPLHAQKAYQDVRYREEDFKVSNSLKDQVISLPMHTELDTSQLEEITKIVNDFVS